MSALISGVLKDGMGKPIPNCTIELKAERTSATVITKTIASQKPEENGSYSMNVEAGKYSVTLCVEGYPPNRVGEIYVHSESVPGTLNYYLGLPTEGDLPPAAIQQFEEMVALVAKQAAQVEKDKAAAAQSAADALASKNAAKTSETNANNSASDAAASAQASKTSETNADNSKKAAQASEADALASQNAAKTSEIAANASKVAAAQSAADALASKNAAKALETNAGKSADGAAASAQAAKASETSASGSKVAAAQSAAEALASKNAAKTSETNAGKSADGAAASAQAAKVSETNAANSKSGAGASAASALASKNDAKTSETNAAASKSAAAQSAVTAKTEADRAAGALASKQDKSEILTDLSNSKDADGVREYLGLKEALTKGDYGLGLSGRWLMSDLGWASGFLMYNTAEAEVPTNCAGWQSSYGNSRRAQLVMDTNGRMRARFSLSTEIIDTTTPWSEILTNGFRSPRFTGGYFLREGEGSVMEDNYNINAHPNSFGTRTQIHINLPNNDSSAVSDYLFVRRPASGSSGQIVVALPKTGGTLALQGTSGVNFKKDITDAEPKEALNRIIALRLVNYIYKDDENERVRFGIIAEEAEKIAPQYIKHNQEYVDDVIDPVTNEIIEKIYRDRPSVDVNPIVMDLLGAIQVLNSKLNEQGKRLLELEKMKLSVGK